MDIRLGYLEESETSGFSMPDALSIDQYQQATLAIKDVYSYNQSSKLLHLVTLNELELNMFLQSAFDDVINKSSKWNGLSENDIELIQLELNRRLLNYLSSVRTYLDHSETFLKRLFGKESEQVKLFKTICSGFYDTFFSYRFFYKLRNYAQHCGLPISNIRTSIESQPELDATKITMHLKFDKQKLLDGFDWDQKTRNDLKQMGSEFDFMPLFIENAENIRTVATEKDKIVLSAVSNAAAYLRSLGQHLRNASNKVAIFFDIIKDEEGRFKSFSILYIPFHLIDVILGDK